MESLQIKSNDDIEVLTVNKELIKKEQFNGFKIQKNAVLMFFKKLPKCAYGLVISLLASVAELIPNLASKVPFVGYVFDAVMAYGKNVVAQITADTFFDDIIVPIAGVEKNMDNNAYCKLFTQFNHHEGAYFHITSLIKTLSTFAMEHPGLALAGGSAIATLAITAYANRMRYNDMNSKQQEVYTLLKKVLKKAKKIKKIGNGDILVNDLNITYDIIECIGEYVDMLDTIQSILLRLQEAIENKNETEYERCRLELETSVFNFDRDHDNILNKKMQLVVETKTLEDEGGVAKS